MLNTINAAQTAPTSATTRLAPAETPPTEPQDRVDRGVFYEVASRTLGVTAGLAFSLNRMVVGACAGGGHGLVKAAEIPPESSETAFKVAMGANLAVTGALAGGLGYEQLALSPAEGAVAGAATNVLVGQADWQRSSPTYQQQIKGTAEEWVENSLARLPEAVREDQGMAARVARGAVGEIVGIPAGVYAAATTLPNTFEAGYQWGTESLDRVANYFAPQSKEDAAS